MTDADRLINRERGELIDKHLAHTITPQERRRLQVLNAWTDERQAPLLETRIAGVETTGQDQGRRRVKYSGNPLTPCLVTANIAATCHGGCGATTGGPHVPTHAVDQAFLYCARCCPRCNSAALRS